jgi:hypothetical protein
MADIKLSDALALYRTPATDEFPAIESRTILNRIMANAGTKFPRVRTTGFLTDIALPEKDGDVHFYIETKEGADLANEPMMACEIQGIFKAGEKEDPRMKDFRQLFGKQVVVEALFRCWPEHLRDSRQPHFFQLHPVLSIGKVGDNPIDFLDRVVWPTGEDPEEKDKTFSAASAPPKDLAITSDGKRIVFKTPSKSMKRENYIHVSGFVRQAPKKHAAGFGFQLFETQNSQDPIDCFAATGTPMFDKIKNLKPGQYEVGGLSGLDLPALVTSSPAWKVRLSPVLSLKKV